MGPKCSGLDPIRLAQIGEELEYERSALSAFGPVAPLAMVGGVAPDPSMGQDRVVLVEDTLGFLLGRWAVERFIDDRLTGAHGVFRGEATMEEVSGHRSEAGVEKRVGIYHEVGELRLGAHCGEARRELRYVAQRDGTALVLFADGRPFVPLDLRSRGWQAHHPCGADSYEIAVEVRSAQEVVERWRVRGPAKDYDAVTTLRRLGPV
jgi:hypothetical protein